MKKILLLIVLIFIVLSCNRLTKKTKETINKGGETIGKTATEFIEGVTEGVDRALECEIILSDNLKKNGLKTGKYSIKKGVSGGDNNLLTLYLIFEKNFKSSLTAKAFDKKGLEIGRAKVNVVGNKDDAGYFDFEFDERTYIEVKSKILIE